MKWKGLNEWRDWKESKRKPHSSKGERRKLFSEINKHFLINIRVMQCSYSQGHEHTYWKKSWFGFWFTYLFHLPTPFTVTTMHTLLSPVHAPFLLLILNTKWSSLEGNAIIIHLSPSWQCPKVLEKKRKWLAACLPTHFECSFPVGLGWVWKLFLPEKEKVICSMVHNITTYWKLHALFQVPSSSIELPLALCIHFLLQIHTKPYK